MKKIKLVNGGLTLIYLFLLIGGVAKAENLPAKASVTEEGKIILSEVETYGVDPEWCTIPAVVGTYMLDTYEECWTDDYDLIRFVSAPSGLSVTVMDRGDCKTSGNDNWQFTIRTVKEPTTTPGDGSQVMDWMKFQTIWQYQDNQIVSPGTMKVSHSGRRPPDVNETSCVVVTRE